MRDPIDQGDVEQVRSLFGDVVATTFAWAHGLEVESDQEQPVITELMLERFRASLNAEEQYGAEAISQDDYDEVGRLVTQILGVTHYDYVENRMDFGWVGADETRSRECLVDVLTQMRADFLGLEGEN
jgi:hypothetical protein